jgi:hypothetical protein
MYFRRQGKQVRNLRLLVWNRNPGTAYAINVKDSYVSSASANAIHSEAADKFHSISIQYGDEAAYTLASGTALSEKIAEMNGKIKRLDATLTAKNFATLYPDLVNNWVATDKTMTCDDDLTVAKILPLGVAAYVEESVTATKYLQTKTLENDRYDLRFISTVNTDDLFAPVLAPYDDRCPAGYSTVIDISYTGEVTDDLKITFKPQFYDLAGEQLLYTGTKIVLEK